MTGSSQSLRRSLVVFSRSPDRSGSRERTSCEGFDHPRRDDRVSRTDLGWSWDENPRLQTS